MIKPPCVFSVDVEDWFHLFGRSGVPAFEDWSDLPSHVERMTREMLALLREHRVVSTFFFLGWVAERWPHLVREAIADGHEVASHGYAHRLAFTQTPMEFLADISKAKDLIEQAGARPVLGYRAPGFSATARTPWFFEKVREAGYRYDSSIFPGRHSVGGFPGADPDPHVIKTAHGDLLEFPISLDGTFGRRMCFVGGGYLRLFPSWLIRGRVRSMQRRGRVVVFYLHPREIAPAHPRLKLAKWQQFLSYAGLQGASDKVRGLFADNTFVTFEELLPAVGPIPVYDLLEIQQGAVLPLQRVLEPA